MTRYDILEARQAGDSDQCSNRFQLYPSSILVNLSCELGQIMTRYDLLWAKSVILSNVRTNCNLTYFDQIYMWIGARNDQIGLRNDLNFHLWSTFHVHWVQLFTIYDCLWVRRVILRNVRTDLILMSIGACEWGQKMTRYDFLEARRMSLAMFELIPTWYNFTFCQLSMWIEPNNDKYDFL